MNIKELHNILEEYYNNCLKENTYYMEEENYKDEYIKVKKELKEDGIHYYYQSNYTSTGFKINNVQLFNMLDKIEIILDYKDLRFYSIIRDEYLSSILFDLSICDVLELEVY